MINLKDYVMDDDDESVSAQSHSIGKTPRSGLQDMRVFPESSLYIPQISMLSSNQNSQVSQSFHNMAQSNLFSKRD